MSLSSSSELELVLGSLSFCSLLGNPVSCSAAHFAGVFKPLARSSITALLSSLRRSETVWSSIVEQPIVLHLHRGNCLPGNQQALRLCACAADPGLQPPAPREGLRGLRALTFCDRAQSDMAATKSRCLSHPCRAARSTHLLVSECRRSDRTCSCSSLTRVSSALGEQVLHFVCGKLSLRVMHLGDSTRDDLLERLDLS